MFTASSAQFFLSTKLSLVYKGTKKGTEVSEKVHAFFIAFERSLFFWSGHGIKSWKTTVYRSSSGCSENVFKELHMRIIFTSCCVRAVSEVRCVSS